MRIANDFYRADGRIDESVAVRTARQRFLYGSNQCFLFVVEFWALKTRFGGVDVMRVQLERLLGVTELPNVSVGVVPPQAVRTGGPGGAGGRLDGEVAGRGADGETADGDRAVLARVRTSAGTRGARHGGPSSARQGDRRTGVSFRGRRGVTGPVLRPPRKAPRLWDRASS